MPDASKVIITNGDGEEYAIEAKDFTNARLHPKGMRSYAEQGFRIVSYGDGSPYDGPPTQKAIAKAKEEKQAPKAEPAPAKAEAKSKE